MGVRNWMRQVRRRWNMPLDDEMLEAMRQFEIDLRENANKVSPRFAFWTILLIVLWLVTSLTLRWNGW
ncbi:MAG: hypothetical protein ACRD5W_10105 [Candidatus Acidiferrales bacterium]